MLGVVEIAVADVVGEIVAIVDGVGVLVGIVGAVDAIVKESSRKHNRDILDLKNYLTSRNVGTTDDDHSKLIAG